MVSLAYGDVQQGVRQLHRPESCYSSQGFVIHANYADSLSTGDRRLNVFRMSAMLGPRNEQVTYWVRIGDEVIGGRPFVLNLTRMAMGLHGMVADGLLFRVSEIAPDAKNSWRMQDGFVTELLRSVPAAARFALIGAAPS
jgi:EpsI family protein